MENVKTMVQDNYLDEEAFENVFVQPHNGVINDASGVVRRRSGLAGVLVGVGLGVAGTIVYNRFIKGKLFKKKKGNQVETGEVIVINAGKSKVTQ